MREFGKGARGHIVAFERSLNLKSGSQSAPLPLPSSLYAVPFSHLLYLLLQIKPLISYKGLYVAANSFRGIYQVFQGIYCIERLLIHLARQPPRRQS